MAEIEDRAKNWRVADPDLPREEAIALPLVQQELPEGPAAAEAGGELGPAPGTSLGEVNAHASVSFASRRILARSRVRSAWEAVSSRRWRSATVMGSFQRK